MKEGVHWRRFILTEVGGTAGIRCATKTTDDEINEGGPHTHTHDGWQTEN